MPPTKTAHRRYDNQRPPRNPPHISLADLRVALHLTMEQVCNRLEAQTGTRPSRGTVSAIENGHRGASAEMLEQMTIAYGLRPGAIVTDYAPRVAPTSPIEQVPA